MTSRTLLLILLAGLLAAEAPHSVTANEVALA